MNFSTLPNNAEIDIRTLCKELRDISPWLFFIWWEYWEKEHKWFWEIFVQDTNKTKLQDLQKRLQTGDITLEELIQVLEAEKKAILKHLESIFEWKLQYLREPTPEQTEFIQTLRAFERKKKLIETYEDIIKLNVLLEKLWIPKIQITSQIEIEALSIKDEIDKVIRGL